MIVPAAAEGYCDPQYQTPPSCPESQGQTGYRHESSELTRSEKTFASADSVEKPRR